jgi:hypothetical protein
MIQLPAPPELIIHDAASRSPSLRKAGLPDAEISTWSSTNETLRDILRRLATGITSHLNLISHRYSSFLPTLRPWFGGLAPWACFPPSYGPRLSPATGPIQPSEIAIVSLPSDSRENEDTFRVVSRREKRCDMFSVLTLAAPKPETG